MDQRAQTRMHSPFETPPALDTNAHALFLDLDGTLVDIVDNPDDVTLSADLPHVLIALQRKMRGALAIITGRSIARADAILSGAIEIIAGVHGQELRTSLTKPSPTLVSRTPENFAAAIAELDALVATDALPILVEKKPLSVALHYRTTPELESAVRTLAAHLAQRHALHVIEGKKVVELAATAHTKGDAISRLMRLPAFANRLPVAVGDDLTDENAFRAVSALGGFSVLVGEARPSLARYRLAAPMDVHAWLKAALGKEGAS